MIKGVSFCQTRSYDMHIALRKTATEDNEVGKREVMRGESRWIQNRKRGVGNRGKFKNKSRSRYRRTEIDLSRTGDFFSPVVYFISTWVQRLEFRLSVSLQVLQ